MRTVFWEDNQLKMIDQRILPGRFEVIGYSDHKSVARDITDMVVRGAPAIGAAAGFGLAVAGFESKAKTSAELMNDLNSAIETLKAAGPTAVNLAWALDRIMGIASGVSEGRSADDIANLRYGSAGWTKANSYAGSMPSPFPATPSYYLPGSAGNPALFICGW